MSYAEITMKSGTVVTFDCTSLTFTRKKNLLGEITEESLKWVIPDGAARRPVHFDIDEIAAALFVDESPKGKRR